MLPSKLELTALTSSKLIYFFRIENSTPPIKIKVIIKIMAVIPPVEIAGENSPYAASIIRAKIDKIEMIRETMYNGFLLHCHFIKYGSTSLTSSPQRAHTSLCRSVKKGEN